ncbi:VanZ family protein [Halorhabdus sp. BNX81]|uniref:VanZ family protein n=1 Tax=Halorhabdus sp. BNX81 TaxID=2980181 RepID=UPI0023DD2D67|nr:VanZ family protein [Halorhabdus sp. BNX81]WEL22443.1 VanZ like family protein [Halorhabdus sp. BNX81]
MSAGARPVDRPLRWLIVIVVAAILFVAAVVEPSSDIARSGPFGLLTQATWLHVFGYAFFSLTLVYALLDTPDEPTLHPAVVPIIVVAYGILLELVQMLIPYRSFGVGDILADAVGAVVVVAVWAYGRAALAALGFRRS